MIVGPLIERKRDGGNLSAEEWSALVAEYTAGRIPDYQIAALLMAVFLRGLERQELAALTDAMLASGQRLSFDGSKVPVIDKHSTGGVGDKVSLVLAPLVAACGIAVPMMSGRGLGHTGGTLDKLEAIPGFRTNLSLAETKAQVQKIGCALIGQTAEIAPADRKLYALRDVTATVESIPLIVASILSKKLAEGLNGLVLDVKAGSGAFMAARGDAEGLARAPVEVASGAGLPAVALLTDMDEVLGRTAGNALEVRESIDHLTGTRPDERLHEVTVALAAAALVQGGLAAGDEAGREAAQKALDDGSAAERFAAMVRALGGPGDLLERPGEHLGAASVTRPAAPERPGCVVAMDCRALGLVVTGLGGNRRREDDAIDPAVGLSQI